MSRSRRILMVSLGGILLLAMLGYVALPKLASHFGFAVPALNAFPRLIFYKDHNYAAAECSQAQPPCSSYFVCRTQTALAHEGFWPLAQVDTLPNSLDPAPPIFAPATQNPVYVLVVPARADCYITYGLQGGF